MNKIGFYLFSALIALVLASSMLFVVDQRKFAVVYQLAEIKEVIAEPGLKWKLPPPFQSVVFLDKRIQTLDSAETRPVQTAEKKNLVIDWLVKWRVTDPKQYIRNNRGGSIDVTFGSIVQNALNEEVTKRTVKDVLSVERDKVMQGVKARLADDAKTFGIEVVDVRVKRVDFPSSVAESVYGRMQSERKQEANRLRSTGAAEGERIRAEADRKAEVIVANAYREAQTVKGAGDAEAAKLFAESFGRDPQFAKFFRSLDAYKASFAKKTDVMVVDPSGEFFNAMRGNTGPTLPTKK